MPVFTRLGDIVGQAFALLIRAEAERQLADLPRALESARAATTVLENQRRRVPEAVWRMVFLDPRLDYFDTYIEVAMELHARSPAAGYDVAALEATERSRARGLLDLLAVRHRDRGTAAASFGPESYASLARLREAETTFLVYYFSKKRGYLWTVRRTGSARSTSDPPPRSSRRCAPPTPCWLRIGRRPRRSPPVSPSSRAGFCRRPPCPPAPGAW